MPYTQLKKTYVRSVDFFIEKGTGRIVPSRINSLTAPTLCAVLRDSLRRFQEQVQLGPEIGLEGTLVIAPYALGGGFPRGPVSLRRACSRGPPPGLRLARRRGSSPARWTHC